MYFHLEYSNNKILNAWKIIFKIFNYQDVTHNMCKKIIWRAHNEKQSQNTINMAKL